LLPRWSPYLLALLAHGLSLPGIFVFDDYSLLAQPVELAHLLRLEQTRPLTYLTFWLNQSLGGWHLLSLAGHLLCIWLLDRIARRLLPPDIAAVPALLFAVHPLLSEPVQYIFARSSLLATLFCLAALDAWTRQKPWTAVAWFLPALLAKEECVAFPLALILLRPVWPPLAAMLALSAAAGLRVLYATKVVAGAGSGFDAGVTPGQYFLAQGLVLWGYLLRLILPHGLTLDPPAPTPNLEASVLGWVALLVLTGLALWRVHPAGRWFAFGLILLLPSSSILPAADLVAWRRLYLPMTAFCLAAAYLLPRRAALPILAIFTLLSGLRAVAWRDEAGLWREAAAAAPDKLRPRLQLARLAPPAEALVILAEAEQIAPGDPQIASSKGRAYLQQGDAPRALAEFGRALAQRPDDPKAILNRGVALEALGQVDAAKADYRRALERDPCQAQARQNLQRLGEPLPPCAPTN
jgi:protein O-mannosyl-transferase